MWVSCIESKLRVVAMLRLIDRPQIVCGSFFDGYRINLKRSVTEDLHEAFFIQ
jgi:hypothetical protein